MTHESKMGELLQEVRRFAARHDLLRPGSALVVGVSGGPDSLCLLHLLSRLAAELAHESEMALRLHVAHLNHSLRGAEADADAAFVAALAFEWGLPCTVARADVATLARAGGLSLEEAARQARYRFLADVAEKAGAESIAVAHNADDQAETVLMHFLRGSGAAGLRGMLPRSRLGDYRLGQVAPAPAAAELWLVRPLLGVTRSEVEAYCTEHGLRPRFDRSNEDTTLFRNRLRHELLPLLASYNPAIREVLAHTAEVLAGDYESLQMELAAAWERVVSVMSRPAGAEVRLDLAAWRALPLGLQRATVREAIHRLRLSLRDVNWEHVNRAVWLAREGRTGQKATLVAGLELEIGYDTLRVAAASEVGGAEPQPWPTPQVTEAVTLDAPGETSIRGGWRAVVVRLRRDELPSDFRAAPGPWEAWLDADAVGPELIMRPRAAGDRFQPQGLGGHSTRLNEFMINLKVPRERRASWPLLEGRSGIAWVCGLRADERALVRPETQVVWHVRLLVDT
jgi:tRNA(Ile)-lysidine synthase